MNPTNKAAPVSLQLRPSAKSHKAPKGQMFVSPCRINEGISSCHLRSIAPTVLRPAPALPGLESEK